MKTSKWIQRFICLIFFLFSIGCSDDLPTDNQRTKPTPEITRFDIGNKLNMEDVTIEGANFNLNPQRNIIVLRNDDYGIYYRDFADIATENTLLLNNLDVVGPIGDTIKANVNVIRMDGVKEVQSNTLDVSFVILAEVQIIDSEINWPMGIDEDDDGNIYVGSAADEKIYKITPEGVKTEFASVPVMGHIHFGPENFLYVCEKNSNKIVRVSLDGTVIENYIDVPSPVDFDWDENGTMYIVSNADGVFRKATEDTLATELISGDYHSQKNCRVFDGYLYVTNIWDDNITRYEITASGVGEAEVYIEPDNPCGFDIDSEGTLYYSSAWEKSMYTYSTSGIEEVLYEDQLATPMRYMNFVGTNILIVHPGSGDVGLVLKIPIGKSQAPRYGREPNVTGIF